MGEAAAAMDISLKELSRKLEDFAKARDWEKYHSPRNLLLAMVGEIGELSEIFQWRGEVEKGLPDWEASEKEHVGEELSDVLLYLIRLSDICGRERDPCGPSLSSPLFDTSWCTRRVYTQGCTPSLTQVKNMIKGALL